MYYPKSQLKTNLYTNGGEFILNTTLQLYKGYYYEVSNGDKYTGKYPQDGGNVLLTLPKENLPEGNIVDESFTQIVVSGNLTNYNFQNQTRILPKPNQPQPSPKDYDLGEFIPVINHIHRR